MLSLVGDIDRLFGIMAFDAVAFDRLSRLGNELKRLMAHFKLA